MALENIGRYRIDGELGRGAMGQVFLAHDPNIGRRLALKTIHLDTTNAEARQRFHREMQAAGRLAHPNIVTIFDAAEHDGIVYIAMELMEGETLAEVLKSGPLSAQQTIAVGMQVASALAHAHEQGVIHRDIKPANIMLSGATVKLMDFGVARLASAGFTATGQVLGTPAYLAPEVIQGQPADARADIFSLGVALYECLTGKRPFDGDNISAVMYKVVNVAPATPQAIDPHVPPALSDLVMRLMEKQPSARVQSCDEVQSALSAMQLELFGPGAPVPALSRNIARQPRIPTTPTTHARPMEATIISPANSTSPILAASPQAPATTEGGGEKRSSMLVVAAVLILGVAIGIGWRNGGGNGANESAAPVQNQPVAVEPDRATPAKPRVAAPRPSEPQSLQPPEPEPAPPPPAPQPTNGAVQLTSTPEGARIRVDGEPSELITPATLELPPGKHKIEVEADGFNRQAREVTLEAGESFVVHIELKKRGFFRRLNPF